MKTIEQLYAEREEAAYEYADAVNSGDEIRIAKADDKLTSISIAIIEAEDMD